jgi:hypothetical protein
MDYNMNLFQCPEGIAPLLKATASDDHREREEAQFKFAKAIELPLRQGVLYGDVVRNIYEAMTFPLGTTIEWPLDLLAPGEEDEFVAYTSPGIGRIAERRVEADYVTMPTYNIANSMGWALRFARDANWNVIARALQVMEAGFVKKINDDGWHVILTAVVDRNVLVYDADATAGQLTKRLISLAKVAMIRNGGGNTTSLKQSALTDVFLAPEAIEDIRNWNVDQIDEVTRREIYNAADNADVVTRIFGVNLHPLREFGAGQEYQLFFTGQLSGSLQASDTELAIGLDMKNKDSFIMPVREEIKVFADPNLHRRQEEGYYGWTEVGFGVLDSRRVIGMSY